MSGEASFLKISKILLGLALPSTFVNVLRSSASLVIMFMIAQLGPQQLASGALIYSTFSILYVVNLAFLIPISILVGQLSGANRVRELGLLFRDGVIIATVLGCLTAMFMWHMHALLVLFGQPQIEASLAGEYFKMLSPGFPALMVISALTQFVLGLRRPMVSLILGMISGLSGTLLAYCLIFGNFGLPKMGVAGAGLAFSINSYISLLLWLVVLWLVPGFKAFWLWDPRWKKENFKKSMLAMGWPIGVQNSAELLAFTCITFMVGSLGTQNLAIQQVVMQMLFVMIMLNLGMVSGVGVLVGEAVGEKQYRSAMRYGWIAISIGGLFALLLGSIYCLFRNQLVGFYMGEYSGKQSGLVYLGGIILMLGAIGQVFDGVRNIATGCLRGFNDTKIPMLIGVVAIWIIGIPLCYQLGFILHMGIIGVSVGSLVGVMAGCTGITMRWAKLSNGSIQSGLHSNKIAVSK